MGKKIDLDKYYTEKSLAEYCYKVVKDILGEENITEILEPSAGNGVFLDLNSSIKGYDIEPEDDRIVRQDYLFLDIPYKKGRLILGNPPYGRCLSLAQKFYKKSLYLGDYIAFILPISQLNNTSSMYEFDLIHSEDLGKRLYTDRELHCVLNIYKRPKNGLNKKNKLKLRNIEIVRQDSKKYKDYEYDIRMCYWGNGSAGKLLEETESYSAEYKIKVKDERYRGRVKEVLENVDWKEELNCIAMLKIQQYHILTLLKRSIPGLD